jgi:MFS family permease
MTEAPAVDHMLGGRSERSNFAVFWAGQTAATSASQLREFVLPLFAVLVLGVTPSQLGLVAAAQWLPFLLFALPVGALIDRGSRKWLLAASQFGAMLTVAALIVAAATDSLSLPLLVVAVFIGGVFAVLFEVGYQAAVPDLASRAELTRANGRLQSSAAVADIGGPGIGGLLIQLVGAGAALVTTAIGNGIAGVLFALTRFAPAEPAPARGWWRSVAEGVAFAARDRYLRANVGFSAIYNLFAQWIVVLFTVYAVRELRLESWMIGTIFAAGAVGALLGAAGTARLSARRHVGALMVWCAVVETAAFLAIPLVQPAWPQAVVVVALSAAWVLVGLGTAVSNVMLITLRQLRAPTFLLGRVNAAMRTVTYGVIPIGAVVGGYIGEQLDLRLAILLGASLSLLTIVWVVVSPLARIRRLADVEPRDDPHP